MKEANRDQTMTNLTGLDPATNYTIGVRAFTGVGPGPLGDRMSKMTLESGEILFCT